MTTQDSTVNNTTANTDSVTQAMAEISGLPLWRRQRFFPQHYAQTACGAHAISYPMSTRDKVARVYTVSGSRTTLPYPSPLYIKQPRNKMKW